MTSLPLSDTAPAGPTILVIDDSATIRSSVERILSGAGYRVVVAEDGFDALAKIGDCRPALIVCDILMPRLDGYCTCALIKASPAFHATPVLMLSAKAGLFDRARRPGWRQRLPGQAFGARGFAGGRRATPGSIWTLAYRWTVFLNDPTQQGSR